MGRKTKTIQEIINSGSTISIAQDVTIEKSDPIYCDKLLAQPAIYYRFDLKDYRYYCLFSGDEPVFFPSVTTLIKNTLPESQSLKKWRSEKTAEESRDIMNERANYGTLLHQCCAELLLNKTFDLDSIPRKINAYIVKNKIDIKVEWEEDLKKDILAFAQFIIDRNVIPRAVEMVLHHPVDYYAGALDLVVEMDWNKSRIPAIIDVKSGKKGFYESHEIQLFAYRELWNMWFGDIYFIQNVFNWSPKDWRSKPTYNLKDQTDSRSYLKLSHLVELFKIDNSSRDNKILLMHGKIKLSEGLDKNINEVTLSDIAKQNLKS